MPFPSDRARTVVCRTAIAFATILAGVTGCSGVASSLDEAGGSAGASYGTDGTYGDDGNGGAGDGDTAGGDLPDTPDGGDDAGITGDTCDPWLQDCPAGSRCAWLIEPAEADTSADQWVTRCVPKDDTPAEIGARCTIVDGVDDCAWGAHCAHTNGDGDGICLPLCSGSMAEPACPDGASCQVCPDCPSVCAPECDPLDPASCPDALTCAPASSEGPFLCTVDASSADGGRAGDTCQFANECRIGLDCVEASLLEACEGDRCCTPYCALQSSGLGPNGANETCPDGTTCQPWSASGPLDGLEDLGVCLAPV